MDSLNAGGRELWDAMHNMHPDMTKDQEVQLLEACRAKDRLDSMDAMLRGDRKLWFRLVVDGKNELTSEVKVDSLIASANSTANVMKQLIAACRFEDPETGKKPQRRSARGVQKPSVPNNVTALDRARNRAV